MHFKDEINRFVTNTDICLKVHVFMVMLKFGSNDVLMFY